MVGAESIDHIAIPVRDLSKAEAFYLNLLGLKLKTRRKNLDGSLRQTYVLAGENIIGLHLPGIQAESSPSMAPRIGIAVTRERFDSIRDGLDREGHSYRRAKRQEIPALIADSVSCVDSDGNWIEIGVWDDASGPEYVSHMVVETLDIQKAETFYAKALGMEPLGQFGEERFLKLRSGQIYGLKAVAALSERSRKHGRGCHIALNVSHGEFSDILRLIPEYGGQDQGDPRADDGLRPEGEKSTYFFDPDRNRLQITAAAESEMLSDEEKWQRIVENRAKQGRGISSWDRGDARKGKS